MKDDGGVPQGAHRQRSRQSAKVAELIIGPIFAQAVTAVGQVARQRGIPVIGFSTDASAQRAAFIC